MGKKLDMLKSLTLKAAGKVTKSVGGSALSDYAGSKLAKTRLYTKKNERKFVSDKTTGRRALNSAATVGLNTASLIGGGGAAAGAAKLGSTVMKGMAIPYMSRRAATGAVKGVASNLAKKNLAKKAVSKYKYKYTSRTLRNPE